MRRCDWAATSADRRFASSNCRGLRGSATGSRGVRVQVLLSVLRRRKELDVASTEELVEAVYKLIASSPTPIPVTLMNHGVDETAAIIGAVVCESAFEFDPSYLRQFKKLPRRSAFGPHAE